MIYEAANFIFYPPLAVSRARRVLIKPFAPWALSHPMTTSVETLAEVIASIRRVSDADIVLLEGTANGQPVLPLFHTLGYHFPRVVLADVRDSVVVEIENPLPKPFVLSTFWVPNIILSCDYLITVAPVRIVKEKGRFSLENLLGILPVSRYQDEGVTKEKYLERLGRDKVIADLYFTVPFDLGIVDGRKKFLGAEDPSLGRVEEWGKILVGEPFEVDSRVAQETGTETEYLRLIQMAKSEGLARSFRR